MNKIISGVRPKRPTEAMAVGFSDNVWEIAEHCWHEDPTQRPSVSAVLDRLVAVAGDLNPQFMLEGENETFCRNNEVGRLETLDDSYEVEDSSSNGPFGVALFVSSMAASLSGQDRPFTTNHPQQLRHHVDYLTPETNEILGNDGYMEGSAGNGFSGE